MNNKNNIGNLYSVISKCFPKNIEKIGCTININRIDSGKTFSPTPLEYKWFITINDFGPFKTINKIEKYIHNSDYFKTRHYKTNGGGKEFFRFQEKDDSLKNVIYLLEQANILFAINTFEVTKVEVTKVEVTKVEVTKVEVTKVEVIQTLIEGKRISNKGVRIRERVKIICELKITYDELLNLIKEKNCILENLGGSENTPKRYSLTDLNYDMKTFCLGL
jgi:hypothetical protein